MSDERSETEEQSTSEEQSDGGSEGEEHSGEEHSGEDGSGEEQSGEDGSGEDGRSATEDIDETEDPKAVVQKLEEEGPPENLEDWPQGKAKYETFGGPEGEHGYHEGPEQQLGPSSLRHHEGGEVEIAGEKVDDPDEYKGDPIPGGPTDPNAPAQPGEGEEEGEEGESDSPDAKGDAEGEEGESDSPDGKGDAEGDEGDDSSGEEDRN